MAQVIELQPRDDGWFDPIDARDWLAVLLDATSMRVWGEVAYEGTTWDLYVIVHRDGSERIYALPLT